MTNESEIKNIDEVSELPKITIMAPTAEEEFERVWWTLNRAEHYEETNARVKLPKNEKLNALTAELPTHRTGIKEEMRQVFLDEVYDPTFYEAGLKVLEEAKPIIEQALPKLLELNKHWGFRIPEEYTILLTAFGTGGSSDYPEPGNITIRTRANGKFTTGDPTHTALHEMLHMGMDDLIAEKYGLTFEEHERLIDRSFMVLFGEAFPDYALQNFEDIRIDEYINQDTISDLPAAIAKYVAENR